MGVEFPAAMLNSSLSPPPTTVKIFTYGTLKRGFSNHALIQDLIKSGDAKFLGGAVTALPLPLVCGPYRVPFLLNIPYAGRRVSGELYEFSSAALVRLDELEGVKRGHYERLPIKIQRSNDEDDEDGEEEEVEAYYAHRSYAAEMWRRSGEKGYGEYTAKVAAGYVKRKDRPQNLAFLDQIRIFVTSQN